MIQGAFVLLPQAEGISLLEQGFSNWGTCTPKGRFAYLKGHI